MIEVILCLAFKRQSITWKKPQCWPISADVEWGKYQEAVTKYLDPWITTYSNIRDGQDAMLAYSHFLEGVTKAANAVFPKHNYRQRPRIPNRSISRKVTLRNKAGRQCRTAIIDDSPDAPQRWATYKKVAAQLKAARSKQAITRRNTSRAKVVAEGGVSSKTLWRSLTATDDPLRAVRENSCTISDPPSVLHSIHKHVASLATHSMDQQRAPDQPSAADYHAPLNGATGPGSAHPSSNRTDGMWAGPPSPALPAFLLTHLDGTSIAPPRLTSVLHPA